MSRARSRVQHLVGAFYRDGRRLCTKAIASVSIRRWWGRAPDGAGRAAARAAACKGGQAQASRREGRCARRAAWPARGARKRAPGKSQASSGGGRSSSSVSSCSATMIRKGDGLDKRTDMRARAPCAFRRRGRRRRQGRLGSEIIPQTGVPGKMPVFYRHGCCILGHSEPPIGEAIS